MSTARPKNVYSHYHAHVYFDAATATRAEALCTDAGARFDVSVGRVHRKLVGPHPRRSCQLAFDATTFAEFVDWLERHRDGLSVLVHGVTGDDLADHTTHAAWLGEPVALDLGVFRD